jgi:hypothetical protein
VVVDDSGESTAGQAVVRLRADGLSMTLVIVSENSTGVELAVYQDLHQRMIRATAGPDEGVDIRSERCYPYCVFVPFDERNALSVEAWTLVLRHEYRHMLQASHNPNMASDFRAPGGGLFTTYAAFSEACADYGLNVSTLYHAQERIEQVKMVIGGGAQTLLDQACAGDKSAYDKLVQTYNQNRDAAPEGLGWMIDEQSRKIRIRCHQDFLENVAVPLIGPTRSPGIFHDVMITDVADDEHRVAARILSRFVRRLKYAVAPNIRKAVAYVHAELNRVTRA